MTRAARKKGKAGGSFADLAYLVRRAAPARWPLAVAAALALVEIAGTLLFPLLVRGIVDKVGAASAAGYAALRDTQLYALLAVLLVSAAAASLSRYLTGIAGLQVIARLKALLFEALVDAPVSTFDAGTSGDFTSRIMSDTKTLSQLVSREALGAVGSVALLVGVAAVLFSLDIGLAAMLFGIVGGAFLLLVPLVATLSTVTFQVQETTAALSARLTQVFTEIRLVKTFGSERQEKENAGSDIERLFLLGRRSARIESAVSPVMTLVITISLVSLLAYGGMRVAAGTLSPGTLTAVLLYIFTVVAPLAQLTSFFSQLSSARGGSARMAEVLRQPRERTAAAAHDLPVLHPGAAPQPLVFEGVEFGYANSGRATLSIDRLVIPAGSRTAIIGPSGSGKSTLLGLIERFYAPARGTIRHGDTDIARFDLDEWRARIGYVAQSSSMMSGTIRSNLLYGVHRDVGEDEIERALRLAHCADFVGKLEAGLDTQTGERGIGLSGGERQRIAIARMFLRDPEILLLDESTAHLDEESAFLVLGGLEALMHGRTTLFVTHRLGAVQGMDHIVMIDSGRVVGEGDHRALLAASSDYSRAFNRTFQLESQP